jgi:hypothetical protein
MFQQKVSSGFFSLLLAIVLVTGLAASATPALASSAAPPPSDPPVTPLSPRLPTGVVAAPLAADATLTVANTSDSGSGSLRQAIIDAKADDTIVFDSSLAGQVIVLTSSQLDIAKNLTIDGTALSARISISGNKARRVFNIYNNASLTLKGVAVINGVATDGAGLNVAANSTLNLSDCLLSGNVASNFGGGVYNYGTLRVSDCTVTGNRASWGGGIENRATLAVTDTTFITNTATSGGAGAETYGGTVTVARSAFINNIAYDGSTIGTGGGFQSDPGTGNVLFTNVTFSGNRADGPADDGGGALMSYGGTLYLTNVTMLNNFAAPHGGGISTAAGYPTTIYFKNSIISGNTVGSGTAKDLYGTFNSQDYNLIGTLSGATLTGATTHNSIGQPPGVNTLADNGGSTSTFALLPGSLVVDFIPNGVNGCGSTLVEDQRGQPRPANYPDYTGGCDLGAFELQVQETFSATLSNGLGQTFGATLTSIQDHSGGTAPGLTAVTRYPVASASLSPGSMPFTVQITAALASGLDIDLSLCFTDWEAGIVSLIPNNLELYRHDGTAWQRIGFNSRTQDPVTGVFCVTKNHVSALSWWTLKDPAYPTAVVLADFTATPGLGQIRLAWQTLMEIDTLGFNVYRSTSPDSELRGQKLNQAMIPAAALGSVLGQSYEFTDDQIQPNVQYYYWLEVINLDYPQLFGPQPASQFVGLFLPMIRK